MAPPAEQPDGRGAAALLADSIKSFRHECESQDYTDTGAAWQLLDWAERVARGVETAERRRIMQRVDL